ncbi:hypothetical protein PWG15_26555 (plasmid) [Ensifer adhaerens]|uniref:type II toxin-antitoxin system VapC family toxin n=1 Tax=Ensifer adhaerens TaxID=106592 RepID=UPI0023AA07EF|nr:hypothetical protein [Ensifer adhaerens]WDZ79050.1 hypothetical protein PWG15_26555 [Ensifer adhaerens]
MRAIKDWITKLGEANFVIPFAVVVEISRGIELQAAVNPKRAAEIGKWFELILDASYQFQEMTREVAQIYGAMTARAALLPLMLPDLRSKRKRLGHDLLIAAASIAHQTPIITLNKSDFLLINEHFSLPGCYDPVDDLWFVPPKQRIEFPRCICSKGQPSDLYDTTTGTAVSLVKKTKRRRERGRSRSSPSVAEQSHLARKQVLRALKLLPPYLQWLRGFGENACNANA